MADKVFGKGKKKKGKYVKNSSGTKRFYDKKVKGKDVDFKSNNFKRRQAPQGIARACAQIATDAQNRDEGRANPHWYSLNDPSVSDDGKKLADALDAAGIPWSHGPANPF